MKVVRGLQHLNQAPDSTVLCIGNFDGVHLGHQRILRHAVTLASQLGGKAVVFTFRPHPQRALRPDVVVPLLNSYEERLEFFESLGIDLVVEEPFSREFSNTPPEQFFNDFVLKQLHARAIVVGYDFAFGSQRQGSLEKLEKWCAQTGVALTVIPPERIADEVISSSRIRSHLLSGNVDQAAKLLGRPFFYRGVVRKGEARGRALGFPTANLGLEDKIQISLGVYATRSVIRAKTSGVKGAVDSVEYPSVTNVGLRPTFTGDKPAEILVETHLLDQSLDLYGSVLEVRFMKRLRDEMKFPNKESLVGQIAMDVLNARKVL